MGKIVFMHILRSGCTEATIKYCTTVEEEQNGLQV